MSLLGQIILGTSHFVIEKKMLNWETGSALKDTDIVIYEKYMGLIHQMFDSLWRYYSFQLW